MATTTYQIQDSQAWNGSNDHRNAREIPGAYSDASGNWFVKVDNTTTCDAFLASKNPGFGNNGYTFTKVGTVYSITGRK